MRKMRKNENKYGKIGKIDANVDNGEISLFFLQTIKFNNIKNILNKIRNHSLQCNN